MVTAIVEVPRPLLPKNRSRRMQRHGHELREDIHQETSVSMSALEVFSR